MDQAKMLREKFGQISSNFNELSTKSISVTSGKGGVGKTSFCINFCTMLAARKNRVLLVDCDFGLANTDVMLNLTPSKSLENVILGDATIEDVIVHSGYNFDLLPASSGIPDIADIDSGQQKFIIKELSRIHPAYDLLVFDTGSGIHKSILRINAAADRVIVVTNPEPTSVTDAYSVMKALRQLYKVQSFDIVVMKADDAQATAIQELLHNVGKKNGIIFDLKLLGSIPEDKTVEQAVYQRKPWSKVKFNAPCIDALNKICRKIVWNDDHKVDRKVNFWSKLLLLFNDKKQQS